MGVLKNFFGNKKKNLLNKICFDNSTLYQNAEKDYNGLFRLLRDALRVDSTLNFRWLPNGDSFVIQGDIMAISDEQKLFCDLDISIHSMKTIIIDMSTEAINLDLGNDFFKDQFKQFFSIVNKKKYSHINFIFMHANSSVAKSLQIKMGDLGIMEKVEFISIDFYLLRFWLDLNDKNYLSKIFQYYKAHSDVIRHSPERKNLFA